MRAADFYQRTAKQQGLRARSAWKLQQLDDKHRFLASARYILELGAAPGGWTQVARQRAPQAKIIACDLAPMQPLAGVMFVQGSFAEALGERQLRRLLDTPSAEPLPKFDLVLSDMSPNLSGDRLRDQARSLDLAIGALELAEEVLHPQTGVLLIKLFQGGEVQEFTRELNAKGYGHKSVKPPASKDKSKEFYIFAKKIA